MGWAGEGVLLVVREGLLANQEQGAKWGWIDNLIIHFQGTTEVPPLANNGMPILSKLCFFH